ncbi:hypothetical protein NPIL_472871 [Nephila pilipes]|uniref:Uncharacterized protein n=1 Tax=Nephila pilipes TaxID=299642 RepID=A0A8X6QUP9_NEPPI|nr:hypothetical protein NPIL_472871 [Nephila pilipes]
MTGRTDEVSRRYRSRPRSPEQGVPALDEAGLYYEAGAAGAKVVGGVCGYGGGKLDEPSTPFHRQTLAWRFRWHADRSWSRGAGGLGYCRRWIKQQPRFPAEAVPEAAEEALD